MKAFAPPDAADVNKRFGETLRDARKRAGFTQSQLAKAIGLERTSVTNIESGLQSVSVATLARICEVLHVSASQLVPTQHGSGSSLSNVHGEYAQLARDILRKNSDAT